MFERSREGISRSGIRDDRSPHGPKMPTLVFRAPRQACGKSLVECFDQAFRLGDPGLGCSGIDRVDRCGDPTLRPIDDGEKLFKVRRLAKREGDVAILDAFGPAPEPGAPAFDDNAGRDQVEHPARRDAKEFGQVLAGRASGHHHRNDIALRLRLRLHSR